MRLSSQDKIIQPNKSQTQSINKRYLNPRTQCLTDQRPYRLQTDMFLEFREWLENFNLCKFFFNNLCLPKEEIFNWMCFQTSLLTSSKIHAIFFTLSIISNKRNGTFCFRIINKLPRHHIAILRPDRRMNGHWNNFLLFFLKSSARFLGSTPGVSQFALCICRVKMVVPALVYMFLLIFLFSVTSFPCVRKRDLKGRSSDSYIGKICRCFSLTLVCSKDEIQWLKFRVICALVADFCGHKGLLVNIAKLGPYTTPNRTYNRVSFLGTLLLIIKCGISQGNL